MSGPGSPPQMPSPEGCGCRLQLDAWQAITSRDATQLAALEVLEGCEAKRIRAAVGCIGDTAVLTDAPLSSLSTGDALNVRLVMPPAAVGKNAGDLVFCCTWLGSRCA